MIFEASVMDSPINKNIKYNQPTKNITIQMTPRTTNITIGNLEKTYHSPDPDITSCSVSLSNPAYISGKPEVLEYDKDYTLS